MRRTLLAALLVAAAAVPGCSSSKSNTSPENDTPPQAPATPAPPAAKGAAPKPSQFAGRVESSVAGLAAAEAPAEAPALRWDFGRRRTVAYDYDQEIVATIGDEPSRAKGKGTLTLKIAGDDRADIVIDHMVLTTSVKGGDGSTHEQKNEMPPMVIQGVTPDGHKEPGKRSDEWYVRALIGLPGEALEVGGRATAPLEIPFNASGSTLYGKGTMSFRLVRYVTCGAHRCAQLETGVAVSGLDVPAEIKGRYDLTLHGAGTMLFDVDDHEVASAQLASVISVTAELPADSAGGPLPADERSMKMVQDHWIRLSRRGAASSSP